MSWSSYQQYYFFYGEPTLKVRLVSAEERAAALRVAARAFNQNTEKWYVDGPALLGEEPGGAVACALGLTPQQMWWGPAQVPACAVGGVSTDPAFHRKGYAGALLIATIQHLREHEWHVCPLWPFSLAFYRKFGWEAAASDVQARTSPSMLRRIMAAPVGVRPATAEDLPALQACHARASQAFNARTVQPDSWWTSDGMAGDFPERCLVHEGPGGQIDGFATYRHWPMNLAEGLRVRFMELQGETVAAQMALARAAADIPGATQIEFLLPNNTLLPSMAPDRMGLELLQRLAVRVIDPAKALACLRPDEALRGRLNFEIMDWVVAGETPIGLSVEIDGGGVTVREGTGGAADALCCPINFFSRLFCGGLTAAQARGLGGLSGGSAAADRLCDALLYGRTPFRSELEIG